MNKFKFSIRIVSWKYVQDCILRNNIQKEEVNVEMMIGAKRISESISI